MLELVVTVAILAMLAAVAVPSYLSLQDKARQGVAISYASDIAGAINIYNIDQSHAPITSIDWSSMADMENTLGVELAPKFSDEAAFMPAVGKVDFIGSVAKVNAAFS